MGEYENGRYQNKRKQKTEKYGFDGGTSVKADSSLCPALVFGTMFQQLYSFADTVIVGRCLGIDALAAVGATYSCIFSFWGLYRGLVWDLAFLWPRVLEQERRGNCTVSCGMDSGWEVFQRSVDCGNSDTGSASYGCYEYAGKYFSMGVSYIRILFLGIPASILYNYSASVLRALGIQTSLLFPAVFQYLKCCTGLCIYYRFSYRCGGAAAATVISQLVSGLLNTWWMFRRMELIEIRREDMSLSFGT